MEVKLNETINKNTWAEAAADGTLGEAVHVGTTGMKPKPVHNEVKKIL